MSINRTAKDWTAGEDLTAADMDAEVRDLWTGLQEAWTAYTPTWTAATTNPVLGNGSFAGSAYHRVGKTFMVRIVLTMGGTTTYGTGAWSLTLPATPVASATRSLATGLARDTSGGDDFDVRGVVVGGSATMVLRALPATAGNPLVAVGAATPFAWATTDVLTFNFSFEAA